MKWWNFLKPYILAIAISFGITGVIIGIMGYSVPKAFHTLLLEPFTSKIEITETLKKFIPLLLATYAFAIPFKINLFNIGGFGQMLFGGAVVGIVALAFSPHNGIPTILMLIILLGVGMAAGAIFALLAAGLKTRYNIDPIVSTIMLNFVGVEFVAYVTTTPPWKAALSGHPMTKVFPQNAWLPEITSGLHIGILIAAVVIILIHILITKTKLGYKISAVGYNPVASKVYGININKTILTTFMLGGAMAGLAGSIEVLGVHHKLIEGFAITGGAEYGVFGILTSLICGGNTIGIPITAFLISVLLVGADAMQRSIQVPVELVFMTQALMVIFIVAIKLRARKG